MLRVPAWGMMDANQSWRTNNLSASRTAGQPADFSDVRSTNLALVLRHVRREGPCSRADVAASTGLNKATVSSLVGELIERRMVRETGVTENRIGRPATMLVLDTGLYAAVGVEINVDYLTVVAVDLAGTRLLSWRRAHDGVGSTSAQSVAAMAALARRAVNRMTRDGRQVLGLSVAVPGLVDRSGCVRHAPNLRWRNVDLLSMLTKALRDPKFPVTADNDANMAAVAEHRFGGHAGAANLVYLTGEVGVGAGVIMDGSLRRGVRGFAGEVGHLSIDIPSGDGVRQGSVEDIAGIRAVLSRRYADRDFSATEVESEIEAAVSRARAGDEGTLALLAEVGAALGRGMSIMANLFDPEVIVLGGYYVPLAAWLLPAAEQQLSRDVFAAGDDGCVLSASTLGHGAAALGAAAQVLDAVDSGILPQPE